MLFPYTPSRFCLQILYFLFDSNNSLQTYEGFGPGLGPPPRGRYPDIVKSSFAGGYGWLFCDPASERGNEVVHYFLVLDLLQIEKYTLTLCFDCFSISSEILIDFGLTFFTVLTHSGNNRENEVPSPSPKACNLIIENRKHRQSDKA